MGGAKNCPETPRQKMISMMYLVLTAMLALNVSAQILNGYSLVNESMKKSILISDQKVSNYVGEFDGLRHSDSIKALKMKPRIDSVISQSEIFINYLRELEGNIITKVNAGGYAEAGTFEVNGHKYDENLDPGKNGDLNIASQVGLVEKGEGGKVNGVILEEHMKAYREFMATIDTSRSDAILKTFATEETKTKDGGKFKWYQGVFEDMPAIATLAVLNKVQNDVKSTQAEALAYLIGAMDAGDFRVNKIQALPVAASGYVMRGSKYSAHIMLAATDSTKEPEIFIGDRKLDSDVYEVSCGSAGPQKYKGRMVLTKKDGTTVTYPFEGEYMVSEPMAIVSADLMNVLYAGFDNPISVAVPGCAMSDISISVSNCKSQSKTSKGWIIKPAVVGQNCKINVSAMISGKSQPMGVKEFRVKKLPDPLAMLEVKGSTGGKDYFKGGKAIAKNVLLTADRVVARLDDADLDVKYKVLEFSLNYFDSMGNTLVEKTSGDRLTDRQKKVFKEMTKAKTVYISNTLAIGQDNLKRNLPPVEVKIK